MEQLLNNKPYLKQKQAVGPCNKTIEIISHDMQGRIQDFKLVVGAHLKKLAERREARKLFGYFV